MAHATEDEPGLALELNPLYRVFGEDRSTYTMRLQLSGKELRLGGVTNTVVDGLVCRREDVPR